MTVVGLAAVVLALVMFVVLHVVGRAMSPVQRTMSEWALLGPLPRILFGVFTLSLAVAGVAVLIAHPRRPLLDVCLVVFALGTAISAFFLTDEIDPTADDFQLSRSGAIHSWAAMAAFLSLVVAAFALGPVGTRPVWSAIVPFVPLVGTLVFVATLVARRPLSRVFGVPSVHGIGERIAVLAMLAWLAIALSG